MGLERKVARLISARPAAASVANDRPACAFGYVVDERLDAIRNELAELRTMTRWLFFLVFSTFVSVIVQGLW
ncbi:MAG: hypothetical protein HPY83_09955 [Anaerolineae bacterium]|nr:hypothetical protein [Anaerolineae bacterium]